jgi:hypothetical protein
MCARNASTLMAPLKPTSTSGTTVSRKPDDDAMGRDVRIPVCSVSNAVCEVADGLSQNNKNNGYHLALTY